MERALSLAQQLRFLRRPIGLFFLILAILGFVLPILPSWPFVVPAVILLGRRDRSLRHTHLLLRRMLRILRNAEVAWVKAVGKRLSIEYVKVRRMITPMIVAGEKAFKFN